MRRFIAVLAAACCMGAVTADVAAANHVNDSKSKVECACDATGEGTITVTVQFDQFDQSNKPIDGKFYLDRQLVHTVNDFTFAGSSGKLVVTLPVKVQDTLEHHVYAEFDWPGKGEYDDGDFYGKVTCPKPPAPCVNCPPGPPRARQARQVLRARLVRQVLRARLVRVVRLVRHAGDTRVRVHPRREVEDHRRQGPPVPVAQRDVRGNPGERHTQAHPDGQARVHRGHRLQRPPPRDLLRPHPIPARRPAGTRHHGFRFCYGNPKGGDGEGPNRFPIDVVGRPR